jgi:hypothetical protein
LIVVVATTIDGDYLWLFVVMVVVMAVETAMITTTINTLCSSCLQVLIAAGLYEFPVMFLIWVAGYLLEVELMNL